MWEYAQANISIPSIIFKYYEKNNYAQEIKWKEKQW